MMPNNAEQHLLDPITALLCRTHDLANMTTHDRAEYARCLADMLDLWHCIRGRVDTGDIDYIILINNADMRTDVMTFDADPDRVTFRERFDEPDETMPVNEIRTFRLARP